MPAKKSPNLAHQAGPSTYPAAHHAPASVVTLPSVSILRILLLYESPIYILPDGSNVILDKSMYWAVDTVPSAYPHIADPLPLYVDTDWTGAASATRILVSALHTTILPTITISESPAIHFWLVVYAEVVFPFFLERYEKYIE